MKLDDRPDPNALKVYAWNQRTARDNEQVDIIFEDIVRIVKGLSREFEIEVPTISTGLLPVPAYDEEDHILYFLQSGTPIWVIAHEFAHAVQHNRHGVSNVQGHGPEFVRAYIDVMSHLRRKSPGDLIQSAYQAGLIL